MRNRKYIVKFRKRNNNRIRRNILIVFVSMFLLLIISSFLSNNVKADEDEYVYSSYLTSNELTISSDKASLLKQTAGAGNDYRNLFNCPKTIATSIITPEVFGYYSDAKALYTFNQYYLNNLDSEYAFKKSYRVFSNNYYKIPDQWSDFTFNFGTSVSSGNLYYKDNNYNTMDNTYIQNTYYVKPDSDVSIQWLIVPASPTTHFDKIDEYPNLYTSDFIYTGSDNKIDTFNCNTTTISGTITSVRVYFYFEQESCINGLSVDFYDGISWKGYKSVGGDDIYDELRYLEWTGLSNTQTNVNNYQIRVNSNDVDQSYDGFIEIDQIYLKLYSNTGLYKFDSIIETDVQSKPSEYTHTTYNTFNYSYKSSALTDSFVHSIYNFDSDTYYNLQTVAPTTFNDLTFTLNSSFIESNKIITRFQITDDTLDYNLYLDRYLVNSKFHNVSTNELGYQIVAFDWLRYTATDVAKGVMEIGFKIYNNKTDYFFYDRSYTYGTYQTFWKNLCNYSFNPFSLDIRVHARYGKDLVGTSYKINFLIELTFNNNNSLYFFKYHESSWNLELGTYLKQTVNTPTFYSVYNSYEREYLFIPSNYSYSCLYGIRFLQGLTLAEYNTFFDVPDFLDAVDLIESYQGSQTVEIENEPPSPSGSGKYWTYKSYHLIEDDTFDTDIGNWTIEYTTIIPEQYTAKFYYQEKIVQEKSMGNWQFTIGTWRISFNFIRDAIAWILNLILLLLQYFLYLLTYALSFLLLFIGCWIITFLFNIVLYWIFVALIWVLWYLYLGLYWLLYWIWQGLIWVYENLLIPFGKWLYTVFLPLALEAFIKVWAFLLTCLIYLITLGQIDFWDTYDTIYTLLHTITDFLFENMIVVLNDLPSLFIGIVLYLLLLCLCYLKYIYTKARGYKERAETLYSSLMVYLIPITYSYAVIRKIYESIPTAGGGGGNSEN